MDDPLLSFRQHFPTLEKCTYLISNSLGAMPVQARSALEEYADIWTERGVRAWAEAWWEMSGLIGDEIGRLFSAAPGTVSMHQNVTLAEAIVVSCFDWSGERNKVVYTDMNFPSVQYLYDGYARALGAEIEVVPSPDGISVPTELLVEAIDERTLLVPISHVLFRSAYIQDAKAICERAAEVGAHVVLDAYQSVGTVPVDVADLDCAFLIGGVLKWLCGGPGGAFLYVRPDLLDVLEPKLTGWMAHPAPFDFASAPIQFTDGAYRFQNGTPNVPALYAGREGPRLVYEADVLAVREKSVRQTQRIVDAALAEGWTVNAPMDPERRGGTVAVDMPHAYEVKHELLRREVIVDYRPGAGIRISPHFYNSDEECDRAIDEIRDILATGAWERFAGHRETVS
ncbi:MAG: aminotransferase class V-fold PLP-dependent enzyme [Planctomycetota bacterium]|nr:aminotransferase class V-fold PLP-dependent enzyme [Planctomycetota bacterium]